MSVALSFAFAILLFGIITKVAAARKKPSRYPPGPKAIPLIGNALDFPAVDAAEEYVQWEKKYGSKILHLSAFGSHVVVLNSREDADELFERRAVKYSDRPQYPITKLIGFEYNMAFTGYGEKWRMLRRICQQHFRSEATKELHPLITQKVHKTLYGLLKNPSKFMHHNKMLSISIPMSMMYGYDVESVDDPCIAAADQSITLGVQLLAPGGSMINILPILRFIPPWFPGASSRRAADEVKRLTDEMQRIPLEFVKSQMKEGIASPSLVSNFYEKKNTIGASQEEETAVLNVASTVYSGASDTTISSTGTFIYLMAVNLDIQKRAQAEIDQVIGLKRLPEFEDRHLLPYTDAIYRELLRWKPPVQLGVPHSVTEDDIYKGYFIPKGTTLLANIWAMTHDETVYPDPFTFKPERFLDANGALNGDDRILAYGFGRRACVGKHVASATLWLTIVSILASFNLGMAKDVSGNDVDIDDEFEDFGFVVHKKPFKCSITPRSSLARQVIEEANQTTGA